MTYDVDRVRARIPALKDGTAYFDGPGGTQMPDIVADAMADLLKAGVSNRGTVTAAERRAEDAVQAARMAGADLVNGDPLGIVFGRSMTELAFEVARTLAQTWGPGDEIVVTRLDHDGDVRPWVTYAQRTGATVRWAPFDPRTAVMTPDDVLRLVNGNTRLVAVTGASNLLGTRPDIAAIGAALEASDALLFVDGVHLTAHAPVDMRAMGADFYACSPYKFLGPHCGMLAASPALLETMHPDKLRPSTDQVPERFELGTLPYELLAGVTAAVDFLADLVPGDEGSLSRRARLVRSMTALQEYEDPPCAHEVRARADRRCSSVRPRPAAHANRALQRRRSRVRRGLPAAGRARGQCPGLVLLRDRGSRVDRLGQSWRSAGRTRSLHERR
jgi:cysteine desulfurase family protein (TIGR01976 family)